MSDFIVGYTYQADNYCPDHIWVALGVDSLRVDTELMLDDLAEEKGFNREHSLDSNDFPIRITRQQAEHDQGWSEDGKGSTCGTCGLILTEWDT